MWGGWGWDAWHTAARWLFLLMICLYKLFLILVLMGAGLIVTLLTAYNPTIFPSPSPPPPAFLTHSLPGTALRGPLAPGAGR